MCMIPTHHNTITVNYIVYDGVHQSSVLQMSCFSLCNVCVMSLSFLPIYYCLFKKTIHMGEWCTEFLFFFLTCFNVLGFIVSRAGVCFRSGSPKNKHKDKNKQKKR